MAYTEAQETVLRLADPVSYEDAIRIGQEIGKTPASVIAKVRSLKLTYVPKGKPVPVLQGPRKGELVAELQRATGLKLVGVERAPASAIQELLDYIG